MGLCPNINLPEYKKLVAAKGEREALYLWAKYNGDIPAIELSDAPIDDGFGTTEVKLEPKTLSDKQSYDVIQEMTFLMLNQLISTDQNLFNIEKINAEELYKDLKIGVLRSVQSEANAFYNVLNGEQKLTKSQEEILKGYIESNKQLQIDILVDWPRIEAKHKEFIRAYDVQFDENDTLQLNDENRIRESNRFDATKIDNFRKANVAIKLLLASNPIVDKTGKAVRSTINGHLLIPSSRTFGTLMNKLHTSRSVEEMLERLRSIAKEDPSYKMLYTRLTRRPVTDSGVDLSKITTTHGIQLISGLWKTFKKQNADVKNVFILENGEVVVADASLSTAALQLRANYINNISTISKADKGFFKYIEGKYVADTKKVSQVNLTGPTQMIKFLSTLGIPFSRSEYDQLEDSNKAQFRETVSGIKQSILTSPEISIFSKKTLSINKRLLELGVLQSAASNPEFSSTYFNLSGERVQSYIGINAVSELHDMLSSINKLSELAGTQFEYLLTDSFAEGSNLLKRMFAEDGEKKQGANKFLKGGYVGGIINEQKNRETSSGRLTSRQRLIQELNLNREGQYINLVPGDASIEHMLYMGNAVTATSVARGLDDIAEIFKGYFLSELKLSREDRPVVSGRDNKDLRFFKGILGEELHNDIINIEGTAEEVYKPNEVKINNAIFNFIKKDVQRVVEYLQKFNLIFEGDTSVVVEGVSGLANINKKQFSREMIAMSVNYMIANIEMHKLLYSDPYQYKDELKRIKSFLSPRQALVSNSPQMNVAYNNIWNDGYNKDDIGYTNFTQDYFKTASHKDVLGVIDLPGYGQFEETDGGGITIFKAHRNFRIRTADWNENEEKQYRYEVAWEKRDKNLDISPEEQKLLKEGNPKVKSAFTPSKPITSGSKLDKNGNPSSYNNIVLDKFSLYPLSYRVMKELGADNGVRLYNKMQKENVDYMVFDSGRKVGAENSHDTYVESTQQPSEVEVTTAGSKYKEGDVVTIKNIKYKLIKSKTTLTSILRKKYESKFGEFDELNEDQFFAMISKTAEDSSSLSPMELQDVLDIQLSIENKGKVYNLTPLNEFDPDTNPEGAMPIFDVVDNLLPDIVDKPTQQTDKGVAAFNDAEYESIVNVPFSIISLQSDVPSKEKALVTRGSQVTKLITMDYMDNGVPFDYKGGFAKWVTLSKDEKKVSSDIFREISKNQELLEEMTNEGYQTILRRLGIVEKNGEFEIEDRSEAAKTLRDEIFKRETNDNVSDALKAFLDGKSDLEATPVYQIVRNILYSIVDKQIVSPKISGGQKVQISSALFESNRIAKTKINGKEGYTSDILKFYEKDGERVMEVMVGRWFKSDMSDAALLEYLNTTDEGKKILSGLAFRIPTQAQNSIDAIRIKKFLPEEFGDSVVVPAAIVEKVGSDFDIDKLSMYLKNVFYQDGKLKLVPYFGMGKEARDKFSQMFDKGKLLNDKQKDALGRLLTDFEAGERKIEPDEQLNSLLSKLGISPEKDVLEDFTTMLKELGLKDAIVNTLYKKSLENEFIQSSENLVTNKENFKRLITPNDATQLEDISKTIVEKVIGETFDYKNVANLLDRRFMSRLRQAFVSGKQAIGIAAVNQTNHSLNQRSAVYVNYDKLNNLPPEDRAFLGDARIKFSNYNKVRIENKEYPSLSGVTNSDKQLISNILSQFIDGYVDISKGPWIMEMGATPNVASTFMFLVKVGVPVDEVAYFMNQPIIRNYLQKIENKGYKFLFIDDIIDETIDEYGGLSAVQENKLPLSIPNKTTLLDKLGKSELNSEEKLQQIFMLKEFLKYSKMANQLYTVTQGTNWDTSNFNDPLLIFKKNLQQVKAQNSLISSSDDILENSYIGNLAEKLNDVRDGLSEFLLSDRGNVRNVLQQVLMPYVDLPNRAFVKVARKAVTNLFDFAVQTDQKLNNEIKDLLLDSKGVGSEVVSFIDGIKKNEEHDLYNNDIINILEVVSSPRAGNTPTNLKLANRDNKVYDQNNIIYSFRVLKEYLKGRSDLYNKIVKLAVLQSGLSNSPISFTSLLPYEDFSNIYNKTLSKMENLGNLQNFHDLGMFQRNNWKDRDIVPSVSLRALQDKKKNLYYPSLEFYGYNNLRSAMKDRTFPKIVSDRRNDGKDYKVFSYIDLDISTEERQKMRKANNYDYIIKGLFKKVRDGKDGMGDPVFTYDSNGNPYFVYKAVNALGDSFRANEFYDVATKSVIDNGMLIVDNEVQDAQIVPLVVKTSKDYYNKVEEGELVITIKGNKITVNNRSFAVSMITYETLTGRLGYTPEQAGEIINAKCKG